jgi:hypothetical protein
MAENKALMRAGLYIRLKIESKHSDEFGWENWLEEKGRNRRFVDKAISLSFFFFAFALYVVNSVVSVDHMNLQHGPIWSAAATGIYVPIGIFVAYLFYDIRDDFTSTRTKG